jgi:hypothetical protein
MPAPPPAPVRPKEGFVPGKSTEDVSKRTAQSKTFRNPDGTHTDQISGDVQHYWTGSRWADISNRLVADPAGGYRNQANSFTARFRSSGVRVETPQGTITLNPADATLGEPVVDSAEETVTYPDVWPGVDVRYKVHSTGVKEELVLRRRPSMSQFPFQVQGTSLTPQPDGSLATSGAFAGKWKVPPPVVFAKDGSTVPAAAPRFSVAGGTVTLAVDGSWLSGLDDAAFPVVLDPGLQDMGAQTSRSYERNPYDNGYSTCEQPCQVMVGVRDTTQGTWRPWRSVQYFPYENLYGKQIIKGQLIYQARQEGTPDPKVMKVFGDDLNGQWGGIWNWGNLGAQIGGNGTASGDTFIFDGANGGPLAAYYQDVVNRRLPFIGLKFLGDETFPTTYTFKRFAWFQLQLTYNDRPDTPYYIAPPANATLNYPDPWLVANNNDPNGDNVALRFRLYREADGAYMGGKDGGFTWSGGQDAWYAGPLGNGRYFWDEWAWDGWLDSPIVRNYFTIAVPPGAPQNVVATANGGGSATVTWTPPASSGGSTIDWYAVNVFYASNGAWTGQQVIVCGTCTSATVTGLALDTSYYFGAYAHTSVGYGNPGLSNTIIEANVPPIGSVEEASATRVRGWVHDINGGGPRTVNIYVDNQPAVAVTANLTRGDPPVADGFEWPVPSTFRDGKNHTVKVRALDYPGNTENAIGNPTLSFAHLDDSWTGTSGPWDLNKWTTSASPLSAVDIVANQGRLFTKNGDANAIGQNATNGVAPMRDADVTLTYRFDDRRASSVFRTVLRGSGVWPLLDSGYRINVTSDSGVISLDRVAAGSATPAASFTYTKDTNAQRIRFRAEGQRVRAKVWRLGMSEPAGWQIDWTDPSPLPASGTLQLRHAWTKSSRSVFVDDLSLVRLNTAIDNEPNNSAANPPPHSVTRYVDTNERQRLVNAGTEDGGKGVRLLTILDFGDQIGTTGADGWGARDHTTAEINDFTQAYLSGFYAAAASTNHQDVIVAIGTYCGGYPGKGAAREANARDKGQSWARLVSDTYMTARQSHPGVQVIGAYDVEAGSDFCGPRSGSGAVGDGPSVAKAWTTAFDATQTDFTNSTGLPLLYANFGSADGCPPAGSCNGGWTQDDYWSLTTGPKSAVGFPEIYAESSDEQWQQIALSGVNNHGDNQDTRIDFVGTLTTRQACLQNRRDMPKPPDQPQWCEGTDQGPAAGWQAFKNTLEGHSATAQPLGFSSDIMWISRAPAPG